MFSTWPVVIIRPADATDVSCVVSLARQTWLELTVRSGAGHSISEGGIMVDLRDMRALQIDVKRRTAWVDFLASLPEIDASRLAYIGHSFGALVGGVLAGMEKRIRAFVLMAGTGSFIDVVALNMPFLEAPVLEHYAPVIASIDPIHYVARAAPAALFFQFGRQDDFTRDQFERVAEAASEPKLINGTIQTTISRSPKLKKTGWIGCKPGCESNLSLRF